MIKYHVDMEKHALEVVLFGSTPDLFGDLSLLIVKLVTAVAENNVDEAVAFMDTLHSAMEEGPLFEECCKAIATEMTRKLVEQVEE